MVENQLRDYNCKDEELPVVCKFTALNLNRDLSEFSAYSPRFTSEYVSGFESDIRAAMDLVEPASETLELKMIHADQVSAMDGLLDPINRLGGYVNLAQLSPAISTADFGISSLRKAINKRDPEGVVGSLHVINSNVDKFKPALAEQGLTEELVAQLKLAAVDIDNGKQRLYEIKQRRKALVQNNLSVLNSLFAKQTEILSVGKILYKQTDPVKLQEYSFTQLMKNVRKTTKPDTAEVTPSENA